MTGRDLLKQVKAHPAVTSSIPLEAEIQWPHLQYEAGELFVQFFFCHTNVHERQMYIMPPRYVVKLAYPFQRVILLADLTLLAPYGERCQSASIAEINLTQPDFSYNAELLFHNVDLILAQYGKQGIVSSESLTEHNHLIRKLVPAQHHAFYFEPAQGR